MQDLTERKKNLKKLQRSEDNYEILFSNNPVPMWAYVERYTFIMVNDAALQMLGYTRDEFLCLNLFDIRAADEHERIANVIAEKDHFEKMKLFGEWRFSKKDGSIITVDITSHLIELNGEKVRLVAANDITEKKKAKQAIIEQNQRLIEISQINSHEIRRPVASILGLVGLFDTENLSNEYNKELIELLNITATELDEIIHVINVKASKMTAK